MKLLVKKLWFPYNLEETINNLFRIPQIQEQFDEGFVYDGEIRPRNIKIYPGYWPAEPILNRLPDIEKHVQLVLTSLDLKGEYGSTHGRGKDRKAIISNNSFLGGRNSDIFNPTDVQFQSITCHEIGHALGLEHHKVNSNPCVMPTGYIEWNYLEDIRFCNDCYKKLS